ncbi:hypothetical protein [Streptomyces rhizosphaericus]|uniref:hypothetical protein n=1 Tax=Streptomyces rhizosphaericus TaxID=114699 RepID=UPI00362D12E5
MDFQVDVAGLAVDKEGGGPPAPEAGAGDALGQFGPGAGGVELGGGLGDGRQHGERIPVQVGRVLDVEAELEGLLLARVGRRGTQGTGYRYGCERGRGGI